MSNRNTRREFIQTTAAAGVGFWAAGGVSLAEDKSAVGQVRFACVGVDGKGASDSADAGRQGHVAAICDVDEAKLNKSAAKLKKHNPEKFQDFREMLDKLGDKIDAVTVSTPDHTHAAASVMAMKKGKHCFCQKPLTHSLYEARRLAEVAREKKVATQMGNQGTAESGLRQSAAIVQAGALGKVTEVHVWTNRPIWPQGKDRPKESPVPKGLNWELWLGPAPYRPYAAGAYHPFRWRGWWDFGTGALGDMACHTMNMPFMALDLRDPISVEADHTGHNKDSYPQTSKIRYEFGGTDTRGPVTMYWYDGGNLPSAKLLEGIKPSKSGALLVGEKGKLYSAHDYGASYKLLGGATEPKVEFRRPVQGGHFGEWVAAIKGGPAAVSNFPDYAGPLTETVLLGNLAVWSGKKVEWDAKNLKSTNVEGLEKIIKHDYRDGYTL